MRFVVTEYCAGKFDAGLIRLSYHNLETCRFECQSIELVILQPSLGAGKLLRGTMHMEMTLTIRNCFGIKEINGYKLKFADNGVAVIYAPNGVMKTSLARVFESIQKGESPSDRIFSGYPSLYSIKYRDNTFAYDANDGIKPEKSDKIYVIDSLDDKIEFSSESLSTLLGDESIRTEYGEVTSKYKKDVDNFIAELAKRSALSKNKAKEALLDDLELSRKAEWPVIFNALKELKENPDYQGVSFPDELNHSVLFNDKVNDVYSLPDFRDNLDRYIHRLDERLSESRILTHDFTDRNLEQLEKAFKSNDLFKAGHHILMREGDAVSSFNDFSKMVKDQIRKIYDDPELGAMFNQMKDRLTVNEQCNVLRLRLMDNMGFIPLLQDIKRLKKCFWVFAIENMSSPFEDYYGKISNYNDLLNDIYRRASAQTDMWNHVVDEFNRRFRVPFTISISNQAVFLLQGDAPNIEFTYSRGYGERLEKKKKGQAELVGALSRGEKHALYLLHTIFDIECIKKRVRDTGDHVLVVADDVADSFDYKNKYAIVEYLNDLAKEPNIDLLVLTHNYDFFRTTINCLGVERSCNSMAIKDRYGDVHLQEMRYQNDFFKKGILQNIRRGNFSTDEKKKLLIVSIPFFRSIFEYVEGHAGSGQSLYLLFTCCMHLKETPRKTEEIMLSEIYDKEFPGKSYNGTDECYLDVLSRIAGSIVEGADTDLKLEDKFVLSIFCRLQAEMYMKRKFPDVCTDAKDNQTRDWFKRVKDKLDAVSLGIIERVLMISPAAIHVNSFMYEPLVDVSGWELVDLYHDIKSLLGAAE